MIDGHTKWITKLFITCFAVSNCSRFKIAFKTNLVMRQYTQYLNCRGYASPHRDLSAGWSEEKGLQNPVEYSSKFRGKSDSEKIHFKSRRRPFFFGRHLILAKKHLDSRWRPFSFLVFIQFRRRNYVIFTKVWSRLQKRPPMQNFTI